MSSGKKFDVVSVGSCMRDLTSFTPRLPKPGETVLGKNFVAGYGGKGANQCLAAAKLGGRTAMVAKVGSDSYGESYIETFQKYHVNTEHVTKTDTTHTGIASIYVADNGENCIVISVGANGLLSSDDVKNAENHIINAGIIVSQLETNFEPTLAAFQLARKHGVLTLLNAAPARNDIPDSLIALSDIFCVNETEAEVTTNQTVSDVNQARKAAELLVAKGCKLAIVTLGEKGAVFLNKEGFGTVGATKVDAVDTTGAGDAFVGALAYFLSVHKELPLNVAVKRACDVATISVQHPGTFVSFPVREDLPAEMFQ